MKGIDSPMLTTKGIADRRNAFDEYLREGGFPELKSIRNRKKYITNLYGHENEASNGVNVGRR